MVMTTAKYLVKSPQIANAISPKQERMGGLTERLRAAFYGGVLVKSTLTRQKCPTNWPISGIQASF